MTVLATPAPRRVAPARIAQVLLWLSALAAALAAAGGVGEVVASAAASRFVELWRVVGFATFAVIFAVLAASGRRVPAGIWIAVIANKVVLTAFGLAWSASADGAAAAMWWDGALSLALIAAFLLTRARR
ncbi:hypothetical protein PROP_02596 [Propionicimonas sp. T2.31MG-18]|uniref:hypothetical protein n=1 Tax=Propionicimonas sp. T2.31MG-18 TaxID=3157620 RepID=UPI0035E488F0